LTENALTADTAWLNGPSAFSSFRGWLLPSPPRARRISVVKEVRQRARNAPCGSRCPCSHLASVPWSMSSHRGAAFCSSNATGDAYAMKLALCTEGDYAAKWMTSGLPTTRPLSRTYILRLQEGSTPRRRLLAAFPVNLTPRHGQLASRALGPPSRPVVGGSDARRRSTRTEWTLRLSSRLRSCSR
jgi:hypothetical protein